MTFPKIGDDQRAALFNRGNHFRRSGEFDKALAIYENIVREDDTDAEAHWCCALCRFGIEYVEDPNTFEYIPTCHRASFDSFLEDVDYLAAVENSDGITRRQYQKDAVKISEVQKGILATSQNEEPFDVFLCYKETDDQTKQRTKDSIDAQEIYYQLTSEGCRVFFARITLEDKAGAEYEPYIFAALNSAKVMVVIGSKPEYFNAVWVKNEWSRYLALMRKDRSKLLIPCYKGMDPYDLPEQLSVLQSYDMSKIGFIQDLIRGIKKVLSKGEAKKTETVKETVVVNTGAANVAPLLKRAFMFLEDGNWKEADEYCEKVLDQDPENAQAYLGKLMAELQVRKQEDLADCPQPFDQSNNYQKAVRFGDEKTKSTLAGYIAHINERNETAHLTGIYNGAVSAMNAAKTEAAYITAAATFKTISGFKDADALAERCLERAETCRKDFIYSSAKVKMTEAKKNFEHPTGWASESTKYALAIGNYEESVRLFSQISGWKDADEQINQCQKRIAEINAKTEAERLEREREAEQKRIAREKAAKKRKITAAIVTPIVVACIAFAIVLTTVIIPNQQYKEAVEKYSESIKAASVGDTVKFGHYEQDNNSSNGKEEIEWIVLAKDGDRLLVISKYALDCQRYNSSYTYVTWETSSLREWMNGSFLNSAFDSGEQKLIQKSTVTADKNTSYSTSPGNNTTDKVFLLSITEANKYFKSDDARKCAPTDYAKEQGVFTNSGYSTGGKATCWWWLRSPGYDSDYVAYVYFGGYVYYGDVSYDGIGVRPALWINLES